MSSNTSITSTAISTAASAAASTSASSVPASITSTSASSLPKFGKFVKFEKKLEQFEAFVDEHGHINIPKGHELHSFYKNCRSDFTRKYEGRKMRYIKGSYAKQRLSDKGFGMSTIPKTSKAMRCISMHSQSFKEKNGHLDFFCEDADHSQLDALQSAFQQLVQDDNKRQGLGKERKDQLQSLGIVLPACNPKKPSSATDKPLSPSEKIANEENTPDNPELVQIDEETLNIPSVQADGTEGAVNVLADLVVNESTTSNLPTKRKKDGNPRHDTGAEKRKKIASLSGKTKNHATRKSARPRTERVPMNL